MSGLTPFQTVGPFLHLGLRVGLGPMIASGSAASIVIRGRLIDGADQAIVDGVLEFWAAGFETVGRAWTGADGSYEIHTRMPASRAADGVVEAPHFAVRVMGRGILTEYLTRVYFEGEPANERDIVLQCVPADRRPTLIAAAGPDNQFAFDIVVQGERETVFFDV